MAFGRTFFLVNIERLFSVKSSDNFKIEHKKEVQVAKAGWGRKLKCHKCDVKYYDMNKQNIKCPECDTPYKPEKIKVRRGVTPDIPKPAPEKTFESDPEGEIIEVDLDDDLLDAEDDKSQDDTIMEDTSDISGDDEDIEEVVGVVDDGAAKE